MTDYHIIGDIHGQADKLEQLLQQLGYEQKSGIYQKPGAKVVFLGDLIDRGPHQRRVLDIVRPMVDAGHALAVMGNHEFNAICYHTLHPESTDPLRSRNTKNTSQHQAFLDEYALQDNETRNVIGWFKKMPVYQELKDSDGCVLFRVVHACWNEKIISRTPEFLNDEYLTDAATQGTRAYEDMEVLLKGPEVPLPAGFSFQDKDGNERHNIRIKWWDASGYSTYRDIAMVPEGEEMKIPETPISGTDSDYGYPEESPPVFFGHYWLTGTPRMLKSNIACLDYSAGKDGALVAYHWDSQRSELRSLQAGAFSFAT